MTDKQEKYFATFADNLKEGINYYQDMFSSLKDSFEETKANILSELDNSKEKLQLIRVEIDRSSI